MIACPAVHAHRLRPAGTDAANRDLPVAASRRTQPAGLGHPWSVSLTNPMHLLRHVLRFRIRYSDIDQMGTYYNARVLEWFEWGRTELCRTLGKPYRQWEAGRRRACPWSPPTWNIRTRRSMMTN